MNAYDVLRERGFVQQVTDEAAVRALFDERPVVAYIGFDPTADSLHAGSLVPLMALMHLERTGHRPIVLLGGGTARVGDPSGKTEMRQLIDHERIEANLAALRKQVGRWFDPSKTAFANNADWLLELRYVDFLRDIGRHFSVNRMLAAESYKIRLERGLSFIEFNYQLLQAYDFLELYRRHRCVLQMGGDDQWGNILAGVDLVRRLEGFKVEAVTFPLLTTATGEKMGKTASGAVWLDANKLDPFAFYQYFVNVHDADLVKLLGLFTFLPMAEVRAVSALAGASLNAAKNVLAYEVTKLIHGREAAAEAHHGAMAGFGGRSIDPAILPSSEVPRQPRGAADLLPTTEVSRQDLAAGVPLIELLVRAGMASSKSEARRLVEQGAVKLNDVKIDQPAHLVKLVDLDRQEAVTVRAGKKKVHRFVAC